MKGRTVAEQIKDMGGAKDMRQYQQLKEIADEERDATRKYYERLKNEHGALAAETMLKQQGWDTSLL